MHQRHSAWILGVAPLVLGACAETPAWGAEGGASTAADSPSPSQSSGGGAPTRPSAPRDPAPEAGGGGGGGGSGTGSQERPDPPTGDALQFPPGAPFEDVTTSAEFDAPHTKPVGMWGMGIAWRDYDADGHEDLFVTGGSAPSRLMRNNGDGTFSPVQADALAVATGTSAASWADIDNDGWPELLVLGRSAGWLFDNAKGVLTDITAQSGLQLEARNFGQATAWADINQDGVLDLLILRSTYTGSDLYFGNGDGTFTELSNALPLAPLYPLAANFVDIDVDGDMDLYIVHDRYDGNVLLRNDGAGCHGWCFTDVSAELAVDTAVEGMGIAIGDFDGDEDFDLAFSDSAMPRLLRNDGPAGFTDITAEVGLSSPQFCWGLVFVDHDADGNLDLYMGVQSPQDGINSLYHANPDHQFTEVTLGSGAEGIGTSMAVARGDLDGDGAPDLAVGNQNDAYKIYRNRRGDQGRTWLVMALHGAGPVPRDPVGTRVIVQTQSGRRTLKQMEIGASFGSSSSPRMFFATTFDPPVSVEVTWPDGTKSTPWPPPAQGVWHVDYPSN